MGLIVLNLERLVAILGRIANELERIRQQLENH